MSDYRINVRFHADVPAEKKAAEYLQTLNKSRNKFIVDAVIAYMNKESTARRSSGHGRTDRRTESGERKKCPCRFRKVRLSQDINVYAD